MKGGGGGGSSIGGGGLPIDIKKRYRCGYSCHVSAIPSASRFL